MNYLDRLRTGDLKRAARTGRVRCVDCELCPAAPGLCRVGATVVRTLAAWRVCTAFEARQGPERPVEPAERVRQYLSKADLMDAVESLLELPNGRVALRPRRGPRASEVRLAADRALRK